MIRGIGELDQVEIAELPAPRSGRNLGAREVRVAVHAAALNHLDLFVVRGTTPFPTSSVRTEPGWWTGSEPR